MKRLLIAVALATAAPFGFPADAGIAVSIGQPGFYGYIDIGDFPWPEVIYCEPIIVEQVRMERPHIRHIAAVPYCALGCWAISGLAC